MSIVVLLNWMTSATRVFSVKGGISQDINKKTDFHGHHDPAVFLTS